LNDAEPVDAIGAAMVGKVNYDDRQFAVYARGGVQELAAGMAAMDAAVAQETDPQPIEGTSDLLVLAAA
jgi:hypothetical protein